ncbi:uncharacterized protein MONOS_11518 [Monocercomonoides exilis]|uniref:uncharacterized protein n=1 Tax=Monocercomonoides exilis TaxID=2049356 RepID=UPI00355938B4|nr:hypothetical protein MONOS_11518 [Monocercomonoides exilis]|eukprot:MONOS_11518.1-p1 / transcript=MONOS_11518.1 / gene=MONOS_11518 / organism=Monocercomonoides_exilis_PA203 / gene_product=unspecified product / transcript_product=unspecified product / location=Mono_scaffold00582:21766-22254(+) / protein_length=142 / sequence_SO=supercontig / SO=protein_coding / is_pseudo=false
MSGLAEQLQEKDKIIRMSLMIILELSEKHNAEVRELKELHEQLVAMKEKNELLDVVIIKEKFRLHHDEVVSVDCAGKLLRSGLKLATSSLSVSHHKKLSSSIGEGSVVMLGPNPSLKELSVKVENLASVAREANCGDGGGD